MYREHHWTGTSLTGIGIGLAALFFSATSPTLPGVALDTCATAGEFIAAVQAEDFVVQQGSRGVAEVTSAVGGKVLGYEFGRNEGHAAEYELVVSRSVKPGLLWFRTARHYSQPAAWDIYWDGHPLEAPAKFGTTGSWFVYRWSKVALPEITRGTHRLKIVARHTDANVNFDMMALSGPDVQPSDALAALTPPPDGRELSEKVASLRLATEHLLAKYPGRFDIDGELRRSLAELEARTAALVSSGSDEAMRRQVHAELDELSRRTLLEENPLMQFGTLLFTRRSPLGGQHYAYTESLSWNRDRPRFFKPGASLCTLSPPRPDGKLDVILESPQGVIRDPDVHFDGNRVLFAHKKSLDGDDYHLYEWDLATRQISQLTADAGFADYEGCYLPDGNIIFNSTRCVQTVDCFPVPASNLYLMDGRGRRIRRVTVNHVHDNFPSLLNDGRVVFTRWEYNDRWVLHLQGLAVIDPDGTGGTAYYGNNSYWPISMLHARAIPGGTEVVCTLSGHHDVDQCGEIGVFDIGRGTEEAAGCLHLWPPRKIEPIKDEFYWRKLSALYQFPYPLSKNFFLVSCKPRGKKHFGIYLIDTFGNRELIFEDRAISCNSPMPLVARSRPPVVPSKVRYAETEGTVYLADVYRGRGLQGVKRGEVKALRIVEMLNRPTGTQHWAGMDGTPSMGLCSSWDAKRVVGTVPVAADGSARFKVPAGTALYFQPLDSRGRALQWMRSWLTLMPGETVACVGCHESSRQAPPVSLTMGEGVVHSTRWYAGNEPFSFPRDVQPVLDRKCVACHNQDDPAGLDLRADKTDAFSLGYEHLRPYVKVPGTRSQPPMVEPKQFGAIASPLVRLLDEGHYDVKLSEEEWDRIVTWIDLNALYYGTYALTRYHANFGRCVVTDAEPLFKALGDACTNCHQLRGRTPGVPEDVFGRLEPARPKYGFTWAGPGQYNTRNAVLVNLTHPNQSRLLRAPLAKQSGGLGLCKETPFADADDPRYRAALAVICGWADELAANPREDMPNAKPCSEYLIWWRKRLESDAIEQRSREELARQQSDGGGDHSPTARLLLE